MTKARRSTRQSLNIRIKSDECGLIDRAARARGQSRTDFILQAVRRAAEEALLDRTMSSVSAKAYAEFLARLDAPPEPNDRLRRTMCASPLWE